jgi:glycerol-3-phosphate dehydrogenase
MEVDLLIVGGGINGTGIARDAAGRGLSVMLVEKDDLASHTSSASSKLVHGGLRYLEQLEFKLVRESLAEREQLLRAAPHIVEPLQFVLPMSPDSRPAWMIRAGLFLYDRLGRRRILPGSRAVRLDRGLFSGGLKPRDPRGFAYWDCRVQDSRLVVLNAMDAAERGATINTRTELLRARREGEVWAARIRAAGHEQTIRARVLVNAAGPWVAELFDRLTAVQRRRSIRLVKGSHIVLPSLYRGDHAFILQNPGGRVVFAIPFEENFTLVGTTEVACHDPAAKPAISEIEVDYLLEAVRRSFTRTVLRDDIVWRYSGVRALVEDGSSNPSRVTRDYVLELDNGGAPLLSVFGGKLTTYRSLAERAVDRLASVFPQQRSAWTKDSLLPGGDITDLDVEQYSRNLGGRYAGLPVELITRLARTYGTRTEQLLGSVRDVAGLGTHFGAGLHAREVDYLIAKEWARTADDILFRRTKLGLHVGSDSVGRLTAYLDGTTA